MQSLLGLCSATAPHPEACNLCQIHAGALWGPAAEKRFGEGQQSQLLGGEWGLLKGTDPSHVASLTQSVRCPQGTPRFWGGSSEIPYTAELIQAKQRGCSRLLAAGDGLMHCLNRILLPPGQPEALLQRQLCPHLLGPGTQQEGLELLPEGCGDTRMGRRAGDVRTAGQQGASILLGRL